MTTKNDDTFQAAAAIVLSHEQVRAVSRRSKRDLIAQIDRWARKHGRQWVIGGPHLWSKDELVSAVLRIERGEEP